MKQKSLLKVFFLLCALIVGSTSVWADPTYEWVLVEDYSELSTSDVYVIAGNYNGGSTWYSLKNNEVTSNAYLPLHSTLTISSKRITSTVSNDETWVIEATETAGEYYIKSTKGAYYLQNPSNTKSLIKAKSSTDNQNIWKIHYQDSYTDKSSNTYTVTGLYNKGTSRMLAIYNSDPKTWRAYANTNYSNINGDEVVFYKRVELPSFTITAESNNTSYGTVSLSGRLITGAPKSGCRYASPAYTVSPANSATVSQDGDEFTVTPSANTTVTINFEEIPSHNVKWNVNGATTVETYKEGDDIEFPSNPSAIAGKVFKGWSSEAIDGTTDTAPTFVTEATMGTSDVTYYAVFASETVIEGEFEKTYGFEETEPDEAYWTINGPAPNTENPNTGSYSGKINTNDTYVTFKDKVNVTSFSFAFARASNNNNYSVKIETSTDNSNWTAVETYTMSSFPSDGTFETRKKTFDGETAYYVRFHCDNTTAVRYVDDVTIEYDATEVSYSNYCTTIPTTISGTITVAGWNTFSSNYALDLSTITGGTAYVATTVDNTVVTMTKTTAKIAAGTGIMVKGTPNAAFTIGVTSDAATLEDDNQLVGLPNGGTVAAGEYNFVFAWETDNVSTAGFYFVNDAEPTLGAGKAYLHAEGVTPAKLGIVIDDTPSQEETDGIKSVQGSRFTVNGEAYNLAGQRVGKDYKGIVIVNGKKIVRK